VRDLTSERVLVTGGGGFLGSFVLEELATRGARDVIAPRSADVDLTDARATARLFEDARPTLVLHLAARVGGIGANQATPGDFFRDNMLMGVHVIDGARCSGAKLVLVGTTCAYPRDARLPLHEHDLWSGYPEETNAAYGVAKRALFTMAEAYRRQYGLSVAALLPANLYGPRDNFELATSHVIPAMIRRFDEARSSDATEVVLWGDGSPSREFLYVAEAARAIVLAAELYDGSAPLNVGTGRETTIRELATLIAREVGFEGSIGWDPGNPNGQPRRVLDVSHAATALGFEARVPLDAGLRMTVAWWRDHRDSR
jgi:GDP-L-fucose synthase